VERIGQPVTDGGSITESNDRFMLSVLNAREAAD